MGGVMVWIMTAWFGYCQNAYFGHNAFPKSEAELIADGITLLLAALAVLASQQKT